MHATKEALSPPISDRKVLQPKKKDDQASRMSGQHEVRGYAHSSCEKLIWEVALVVSAASDIRDQISGIRENKD